MVDSAVSALLPECRVLVVDGRSGSGKTSLADRIARAQRAAGRDPQMLRVEDLYPGWDGLAAGSRAVVRALDEARYRRYDWIAGEFTEEVSIGPGAPLIIEGCGAITRENLRAAMRWSIRSAGISAEHPIPGSAVGAARDSNAGRGVRSVWISAAESVRYERAIARDNEMFAPHWERWAEQERAHFAVHQPWLLADRCLPEAAFPCGASRLIEC